MNRGASQSDRLVDFLFGELGNVERHEADREQPLVAAAEVRDGAIVRARAAVKDFGRRANLVELAPEMRDRESGEDQLRAEAEQIERAPPLVGIECAERFPSLAQHQVLFRVGDGGRILVAFVGMRDRLIDHPAARADRERMQLGADVGVGVRNQPVARLHDVAVGVVEDSTFGVWHRDNLGARWNSRGIVACAFRLQDSGGRGWRTEAVQQGEDIGSRFTVRYFGRSCG